MRVITLIFGLLTLLGLGLTATIPLQERGKIGNNMGDLWGVQNTATCTYAVNLRRFKILYNEKDKTKETWKKALDDHGLEIHPPFLYVGSKVWSTYKYRVWGIIKADETISKIKDQKERTAALKEFNLKVKTNLTQMVKDELKIVDVSCTQGIFSG